MSSRRERASLEWWLSMVPVLGAATAFMTTLLLATGSVRLGYDFRASYLAGAELLVDTGSPYTDLDRFVPGDRELGYVYPPQLALALVPLTPLPVAVAAFIAFLGSVAALFGALALVGVRDVRCYAAVVLWTPGWFALEMANASSWLALLLAVAWRYRARLWPLALALGTMVSLKLFLWPLLVWAAVSERFRAVGLAIAIGGVLILGSWAAIGFSGMTTYHERVSLVAEQDSFSIAGMVESLGFGDSAGTVLTFTIGGAILLSSIGVARRGNEAHAFLLAIVAALALSPIVWLHYLVALVVPMGILRPRFSVVWLLPIVLWVCPRDGNGEGLETYLPALVVIGILGLLLMRPRATTEVLEAR
jgi:glycosyl transferase family 87